MDSEAQRTVEDALLLVKQAKVNTSDLRPNIQCIEFLPKNDQKSDIQLVELTEDLLGSLEKGEKLYFKGNDENGTVLCTKEKTFEVREAETSNSLLIVNDVKLPNLIPVEGPSVITTHQVEQILHKYLEIRPCQPKLKTLYNMLGENLYKGKHEERNESKKYTLKDFLDNIQASEDEIKQTLVKEMSYKIDGYWRQLEFGYHFAVLSLILNLIESNSWSLDAVPRNETLKTLEDLEPLPILEQCFDYFLEPSHESDKYRLKDDCVSRFCGEVLLKTSRKFNLADFLTMWQESVPDGVVTTLSQLEGIALVDRSSPSTISYLPVTSLPDEPIGRFEALFEIRSEWKLHEISPFLQDLATPEMSVTTLLMKYVRTSTKDGFKVYTSKYCK